jgi:amino acid adenylation domain-containing protein
VSADVGSVAPGRPAGELDLQRAAPTQQRLWLLAQLHPDSWIYNLTSSVELTGELDPAALRQAARELYGRHEALRMTFRQVGSEVYQSVSSVVDPPFEVVDLSDRPDPREAADRAIDAVSETPMDLSEGPLFKVVLCRLGPDSHMLTLFVHHIVADAWSLGVMWEDLGLLYARHRGAEVTPEPVAMSYREYAQEEWRRSQTPEAREELARWLQRLEGVDTDNSLRTDRRRPAEPSFRGDTVHLRIPAELARPLQERARALRGTSFMVLLAGFAASLALYDRKREVVVATQVAGRADHRLARTVGFFINTLPLRFQLDGGATLQDLVRQARELALEAFTAEHVTFEQLVQEVSPLGDRSMNPLAQIAFQLLNVPFSELEFGDLQTRRWWDSARGAKFDLGVMLVPEADGGLRGLVTYATDLFDEETIRSLWQAYTCVLERLVAEPDAELRSLDLLGSDRRRAVEGRSRGPQARAAERDALLDRLAGHARDRGARVALSCSPGADLTYAELWSSAGGIAAGLAAAGVGANDVVAVGCASRPETICAILGAWRAGATPMVMEAAFTSPRLLEVALELGVRTGIASVGAEPPAAGIRWLPFDALSTGAGEPDERSPPEHAYIVTTSGTTGRPRAVAAGMEAFGAFVTREAEKLGEDRVVLQVPPLGFDPGMRDAFTTLAAGAELVIGDQIDSNPIDAIADALEAGRVDSILAIVPSVLDGVLNELAARGGEARLRTLHCCGEALPRALAARAARALDCVPANDYGSSECTMVSTSACQDPGEGDSPIMPLGRPLPGVEAWVLGEGGQLLPPGFTGEIHIAGPHLTSGYLGDAETTAERFVPHPYGPPGARLHRTGDLGYFDAAGELHWVGRLDRQVKVRGVRVEVAEVEAALLEHAAVQDVAVVPVGEGVGIRLVAYAVVAGTCAPEDLRQHLRGSLPRASVPSSFQLVTAIPRSRRGKVQVDLLPAPAPPSRAERQPLSGEVQRTIAEVWDQVLSNAEGSFEVELGADDDFFELGGDSLAALQMVTRVSAALDCRLTIGDAFDHPTIADLAARVEELRR